MIVNYRNGRKILRVPAGALIEALTEERNKYKAEVEYLQARFTELQADVRDLKVAFLAYQNADAIENAIQRQRTLARAWAAERDPTAPLQ